MILGIELMKLPPARRDVAAKLRQAECVCAKAALFLKNIELKQNDIKNYGKISFTSARSLR
jgi:hypothetical protein